MTGSRAMQGTLFRVEQLDFGLDFLGLLIPEEVRGLTGEAGYAYCNG